MTEILIAMISIILNGRPWKDVLFELSGLPEHYRDHEDWLWQVEDMEQVFRKDAPTGVFWLLLEHKRKHPKVSIPIRTPGIVDKIPNWLSSKNQHRTFDLEALLVVMDRMVAKEHLPEHVGFALIHRNEGKDPEQDRMVSVTDLYRWDFNSFLLVEADMVGQLRREHHINNNKLLGAFLAEERSEA